MVVLNISKYFDRSVYIVSGHLGFSANQEQAHVNVIVYI